MTRGFAIGEAARRAGCSVATIRYYEETGLLAPAPRTAAGRRVYTRPDVERLRLIRRLRSMDFDLAAVRRLLDAMDPRGASCLDVRDLALAHLKSVRARMAEIEALERTLAGLAGACAEACPDGAAPGCTIIRDFQSMDQAARGP